MVRRSFEQVKSQANVILNDTDKANEIKRLGQLVNLSLTREQAAFAMASVEDSKYMSDGRWKELLTEAYTGTDQSTYDMGWTMTGFDGTEEERKVLQPFLDTFYQKHNRYPNLSPNEAWGLLIDTTNQENNKTNPDLWNETFAEAEPDDDTEDMKEDEKVVRTGGAATLEASAAKVAALLSQDTELMTNLSKIEDYNVFLKIAPVLMMQRFEKTLGGDTMLGAPEPGSISMDDKGKETFLPIVGNTMYDVYKVPKGKKTERRSYYKNVYLGLPQGVYASNEISKLDQGDAKAGAYVLANGWGQKRRDGWRSTIETRLKSGAKAVSTAFSLFRNFQWLQEFKDIHVEIITDEMGNLATVAQPFWVCPMKVDGTPNHGDGESYSVGELLAFNRAKTEAEGNDFTALMKSRKRASPAPETPSPSEKPKAEALQVGLIKDMRQLDSYTAVFGHFALDAQSEDWIGSDFSKLFDKKFKEDDAFVESWYNIMLCVRAWEGRIQRRHTEIEAKRIQDKKIEEATVPQTKKS